MQMTKFETRNSKLDEPALEAHRKVKDFTDLQVWALARELRKKVYSLSNKFPPDEKFGLTTQLRRAAVSITANIAEGFGRYSYQENVQFCRVARGSAFEVRDHLIAAEDEGFISQNERHEVDALAQRVVQTLNGYIRATKERLTTKSKSQPEL